MEEKEVKIMVEKIGTDKHRCKWCNLNNPLYIEYHDNEWGVPLYDDGKLFERAFRPDFPGNAC